MLMPGKIQQEYLRMLLSATTKHVTCEIQRINESRRWQRCRRWWCYRRRLADELSPVWWQIETSSIFSLIKKHAHPHSSTERWAGGKSPPNWLHSTDRSRMSSIDSLHLKRNVISEFCHTRRPAGRPASLVLHKLQTTFLILNSYRRFVSSNKLYRCANIPKKKTWTDV